MFSNVDTDHSTIWMRRETTESMMAWEQPAERAAEERRRSGELRQILAGVAKMSVRGLATAAPCDECPNGYRGNEHPART